MNKQLSIFILLFLLGQSVFAQISPGDLSKAHAGLEGVSNCTKCHDVGNKVTRQKCLDCHKEIKANIAVHKGYHASAEVGNKECSVCHNEHHGRNFQLIRFTANTFDHRKTGFELKGVHAKQNCKACHQPAFIKNPEQKKKSGSYLGLKQDCLNCHPDFHQGHLSPKCTDCHGFDSFSKSTGFDHNTTKFPLLGKHKNVDCVKCHKTELVNGKPVQKFSGLAFANCNACHKDVHEGKFGQNCKQCHTEESFHFSSGMKAFDHDKTGYKLLGKHKLLDCKQCHKSDLTAPIKHDRCSDCHTDYHKKEFAKNGVSPDCSKCHTNAGFSPSTFTVEQHNAAGFKLEGAHLATPCMACHKKQENWTFKNLSKRCVDCHKNVHKGLIADKYYPNEDCTACHNSTDWKQVNFDHNKTNFKLDGAHAQLACVSCHYRKNAQGVKTQVFAGLSSECSSCHKDEHRGQFDVNGKTDCTRCHTTTDWHTTKFDHNTTRFKLVDGHAGLKCEACHKPVTNEKGKYIQYKFKDVECSNCHS